MAQSRPAAAGSPGNLGGNNGQPVISDDTITQAQGFLSAPQVEALQQIQKQQQTQRRLQQLMLQNAGPGAPAAAAPGN